MLLRGSRRAQLPRYSAFLAAAFLGAAFLVADLGLAAGLAAAGFAAFCGKQAKRESNLSYACREISLCST